jgi:pyridoxal phosphate enzyme (YggS family)
MSSLAERLAEVEARIQAAAKNAARSREDIELIVVSKNHPAQLAIELIQLGVRSLGENRDQEAKPKALEVAEALKGSGLDFKWHFIGQLQSNKVRSALSYASVIHSLDRQSLLDSLAKATSDLPKPTDVFIQLNLTDDPGRGGIQPKDLRSFADQVLQVRSLNLLGVMGVASLDNPPELDFARIQTASTDLQGIAPGAKFISAGMSEDFEAAIGYGATHLRIGSAITGKRQY